MDKKIIAFNIIYYAVIFFFVAAGREDPSSSLGYGYFILFFWLIAAIVLIFLLARKIIRPVSLLDKIGIFTATPALCIITVRIILFVTHAG